MNDFTPVPNTAGVPLTDAELDKLISIPGAEGDIIGYIPSEEPEGEDKPEQVGETPVV